MMKKISKRDSLRLLNHLKRARAIIDSVSDDGEIMISKIEIAEDCVSQIDGFLIAINNTLI